MINSTLCYVTRGNDVLMLHRVKKKNDINKDKWIGVGGKFEEGESPDRCLLREVQEESGLTEVRPVSEEIYSLEILSVSGHWKKGCYIPSHLHLNVTYLLEANPTAPLRHRPGENSAVAWIAVEDIPNKSTEAWFVERIYPKLCNKSKNM